MNERDIFMAAVQKEASSERRDYVADACQGNEELRQGVEALLAAHERADGFLAEPAVAAPAAVDGPPVREGPGAVIGPYKLLEQIGEGGFGIVYMAEQQRPVRRKVALKIVKLGLDTRQVVARFEAERQALALMDHPNIAHVLDAGETASGRPYFVMELVRGVPITDFCDANPLPVRQRLELFVNVCQAVQHAHQKGIIHRDLKPTNLLITLHDGTPVVKIIDFGISKALGQQLTEKTLFTNFAQMIGTPIYMSPEQAEMSGLDIDTRSDIYSLGVLLYELLTGTTPRDKERLKTAAYDEIRRIIREEEPAKPSTRMSTLGKAAPTVSANRQSDPKRLCELFKGELDWIVMKALEKDRNRRYETASAFAADVQRYLNDEQVQACPPSALYRFGKFARRHKPALAIGVVLTVAVVVTLVTLARSNFLVTRESAQKERALQDKEAAVVAAEASARHATDQLFLALLNQARAERVSGRAGQRFEALKAIRRAAQIRVTPELRIEAIAALVMPDVEIAQEWDGFPEGTLALAFDADFQRFARLSSAGNVTVGRLIDNREEVIARLPARGKPPYFGLWLSPDGSFVAYGHSRSGQGVAGGVCVWRLDGSEPVLLMDVREGACENALAFRPNGRQLAIGHADKSVSVYDLATGERVQRLASAVTAVNVAFHPRDSRLALATNIGVLLFDADTGAELPALRYPAGVSYTYSVAWHPDGRRLAAGCNDRKIHIWDTETGAEAMPPWVGIGSDGSLVAFNHAGDRLGSVDWSGLAHVWDVATGRPLLTGPGISWQFSPSDRLHGYSIEGAKVKVWRLAAGRELRVLRRRNADSLERLSSPVLHADGRILATRSGPWLSFFDLVTGEELASAKATDYNKPFCFDSAVGWISAGTSGVLLWPARSDPARPEVLRVGPPEKLDSVVGNRFAVEAGASTDGAVLAVPEGNFTALIHRKGPVRRTILGPQFDIRFVAVSPDGRWVATCSHFKDGRSKSTRIWDADTGKQVHELPLEGSTNARFSPNGRWLATYNASGTQLWEVGTWQPGRRFEIGAFAFSPDSSLIALGGSFGVVRLLETDTGHEVARLTGPEPTLYAPACFTPDGTRLIATNSDEKKIHVWDLRAIRRRLKEMGLDWTAFSPVDRQTHATQLAKVEVVTGDPANRVLTLEQKARQTIERCRLEVQAQPDNPEVCNELAWIYVTAPLALRDVKAAVPLAENAVRLAPGDANYRNTLGVAYYRIGRYREAVETLRPNLDKQEDRMLAFDLYFLAMSHHRLGETEWARNYLALAVRWTTTQPALDQDHMDELNLFRAEAEELIGTKKGPRSTKDPSTDR